MNLQEAIKQLTDLCNRFGDDVHDDALQSVIDQLELRDHMDEYGKNLCLDCKKRQ
jgi:hypothetical protein